MIVLDCSAAFAIAQDTHEGRALAALVCKGERVIAPTLLQAEAANVAFRLVHQLGRPQAIVMEELRDALSLVDEFVNESDMVVEAASEAARLGHSAYDLFYLVLARRRGATLLTLDRKLMKLCAANGVACVEEVVV
ncbi:MAG: type II toxin-antitoxin system VapC family toxin [Coriobacteriia bacterium]|nr:type II toxin-antitoxin system VapC family toxin [Coriobacteriia bacterium]